MNAPRIAIASTGERDGLIIAVMPAADEYTSGAALAVGSVYQTSPDGKPEKWRAWLWPEAGGALHVTQHCEAVDAADLKRLGELVQKRAGKDGPWWGASS